MSHRYIDHWFLDWMFVGLCSPLVRCHKISKVQEPNPINVTISDVMPPMHRCQICSIHFTSSHPERYYKKGGEMQFCPYFWMPKGMKNFLTDDEFNKKRVQFLQ